MGKNMEKVFIYLQMGLSMMEIGKTMIKMETEYFCILMEINIKVNLKTEKKMGKEFM